MIQQVKGCTSTAQYENNPAQYTEVNFTRSQELRRSMQTSSKTHPEQVQNMVRMHPERAQNKLRTWLEQRKTQTNKPRRILRTKSLRQQG